MNQHTIREIARVCHEINRAYCAGIGDNSQPAWEDAPDWQRDSAIVGVEANLYALANTGDVLPPSKSHESWLAQKKAEGWKYGPVKNADPAVKEHPCFVPYSELPPEQRVKDYLFGATIKALATSPVFQ